ncbi:MAG: hypothetical protein MUO72_17875 [Bacteroidales bacterium]|nr:hypothetical protein [Bacteroidales bacterium]
MSKDSPVKDEEIDLLELFRRMGKTLSKWLRALGKGVLVSFFFLLKNFFILGFGLLLGVGVSYVLKWTSKPFYSSEITLRSNMVSNSEMILYINKLNLLLKEENYPVLATSLSINQEKAETISDIEAFWIIDMNNDSIPDFVDYRNKHNVYDTVDVRMNDRFAIKVEVSDPQDLTLIRDGILSFVKNNPVFQQKNNLRLDQIDEMVVRLDYDIKQLDSLQQVKYFEETRNRRPEEGGQMIFLQEQKTQLIYEDIYKLYNIKQELEQERNLYPGTVTIINDFYLPNKRYNGGYYFGKVIIPLFFGLTLLCLILIRNRKKLQEVYKKYKIFI